MSKLVTTSAVPQLPTWPAGTWLVTAAVRARVMSQGVFVEAHPEDSRPSIGACGRLWTGLGHRIFLRRRFARLPRQRSRLFQGAVTAAKSKTRPWRKLRNPFDLCLIPSALPIRHPPAADRPQARYLLSGGGDRSCSTCRLRVRTSRLRKPGSSPRPVRVPGDLRQRPVSGVPARVRGEREGLKCYVRG
jgi:hypothetical protein